MIEHVLAAVGRRPNLAAALGLAILVVLLFSDLVFHGRVLFERDIHLFWYAQVEDFVRIVTTPAWPLWDPYAAFGQPLLTNVETQVLYPLTWLNLLMRPWTYYSVFVVLHLWLAGFGLYRLGNELGLSRVAAFLGGCLLITALVARLFTWF